MSTVYAIRHQPTGLCMPALSGGYSYWEPTTANHEGMHPRLFFTLKSAQNALSAWLQGQWKREQWSGYDWEGIPDGYDKMTIKKPPAPRRRDDMKIVVLDLTERAA